MTFIGVQGGPAVAVQRRKRDFQLLQQHVGPIAPRVPLPASLPSTDRPRHPVLVLDVRRLQLLGVFKADSVGQLRWVVAGGSNVSILYSHQGNYLTIHEVDQGTILTASETRIEVSHLAAFSGRGSRPWLLCPIPECGRRALKLYLPEGDTVFRCRTCLGRQHSNQTLARLSQATTHALVSAS